MKSGLLTAIPKPSEPRHYWTGRFWDWLYLTQSGRVVVVGEKPLLEAIHGTNGQPALILYALAGTTNIIESTPSLNSPMVEEPALSPVVMTNLLRELPVGSGTNRTMFYRAVRK